MSNNGVMKFIVVCVVFLLVVGCGSAESIEVEVTRVVTEKVVEEVEVVKEVEVIKEVEVTRLVEVEKEVVVEVEVTRLVEGMASDEKADSIAAGEMRQIASGVTQVFVPAGEAHYGGEIPTYDPDPSMVAFRKTFEVVDVEAFWIDKTEVTNAQFAPFIEETGLVTAAEEEGFSTVWNGEEHQPDTVPDLTWQLPDGETSWEELADHPVVNITTAEAAAFCEWRGARLPTDYEWEKAASWDSTVKAALKFPWGDELDDSRANACDINCVDGGLQIADYDDGFARTAPVDSFAAGASPYGALNMVGNVFEFVHDDNSELSVFRGGGWNQDTLDTEVKARQAPPWAGLRGVEIGFRCAEDG